MIYPETMNTVLCEVAIERGQQDIKWGEQNHPDGTGPSVRLNIGVTLACNIRDWMRAWCDSAHRKGEGTWLDILLEETFEAAAESDPEKLRTELVQVAAVATAWIEAIDRRKSE